MQKQHNESKRIKASELAHSLKTKNIPSGRPTISCGASHDSTQIPNHGYRIDYSGMAFETVFKWSSVFCLEIIGNQNGKQNWRPDTETIGNRNWQPE